MSNTWLSMPLGACTESPPYPTKVPRTKFLVDGTYPVISQEQAFINGYWSEDADVLRVQRPVVVFGDHTRVLKYVDFDFVVGADGVKVLQTKQFLDSKYLYYFLQNVRISAQGYARHFRFLKEVNVRFPESLTKQKRIVAILDEAFVGIEAAIAKTEKNLVNARELFDSYLDRVFSQSRPDWLNARIEEYINFIDYRGRTPTKTVKGLRLITAKNVKMGFLREEPKEFVDPAIYEKWMTRGIPQPGDVLFTTEAPLGNVAQLDTGERVIFAQRVIIMQPDRKALDPTFLRFMLMSRLIQDRIHAEATGATAKGIKASRLKRIAISFPRDLSEQRALAETLNSVQAEASRLEAVYRSKLSALAELKQSLLQKAFAGELTANEAEREMAAA